MTYRLIAHENSTFTIAGPAGDLARTTNEGRVFITTDRSLADEALGFLNQPVPAGERRRGSHRMKSMFGPL